MLASVPRPVFSRRPEFRTYMVDATPLATPDTPHPMQQARALIAQGFRVLPVGPDKLPLVDGFGADDPDGPLQCGPEWFADPGTSVGVLCGPCDAAPDASLWLVCVDVDGDPKDNEPMAQWLASLPTVLRSHRGRHLWFWAPAGTRGGPAFKRPGEKHGGLDLKSFGGYARETWTWDAIPDVVIEDLACQIPTLPAPALEWLDEYRGSGAGAGSTVEHAPVGAPAGELEGRGDAFLREHGFDPLHVREDAARWLRTQAPRNVAEGQGSAAGLVVAGALLVGFGLADDVAAELMIDVWAPLAWPDEEPDDEGLMRKLDEIDRLGSTSIPHMSLAAAARNARRAAQLEGAAAVGREARVAAAGGIDHPEQDHSGCRLSPLTGWPYILQKDRRFWLHKISSPEYHPAVSAGELTAAVYRHLRNQVLFNSRKDLESTYIRPVGKLTANYLTKQNTYNAQTDTLSLALLEWMDPSRARFHAHIDAWLRALAGERYPKLAQWLVSCTTLDRPAPLLYMAGEGNLGKTLLMNGLASLWGVDKPGKLREVISDFNECLEECPLVFGDEGLPSNISFDWLRESITEYSQRLNTKGIRKFSVRGCARYAVAANNFESFRYLKVGNLTKQDLRAIASRILAFECQPAAEQLWQQFDTHRAAAADIPEHILWLVQSGTAPVEPPKSRMAARSGGGELLMDGVLVNRYSEILLVLRAALEDAGTADSQGRDAVVIIPKDAQDELWIPVTKLHTRLASSDNKTSLADVRAFCKTHELRPAEQHKIGGVNTVTRILSRESVEASIQQLD